MQRHGVYLRRTVSHKRPVDRGFQPVRQFERSYRERLVLHDLRAKAPDAYTVRQTAYDLRKFRGQAPGRQTRAHPPLPCAARGPPHHHRRHHHPSDVLAPLIGEVRSPRRAVSHKNWTPVEHDYEKLRSGMEDLFEHLGMATAA